MENDSPRPLEQMRSTSGFDLERALVRFGGDRELFEEMVEVYFTETMRLVGQVRQAAADNDLPTVERAAHSIKGTIGYFGVEAVVEAARRVEQAARARDPRSALAESERLEDQMAALGRALTPFRRKAR